MLFFYLITLLCGSNSLPLSSLPYGGANNIIPLNTTIAQKIIDNKQLSSSSGFLTEIKANPQAFIAEVQNLDPDSIKKIIALLIELRGTSESHEDNLIDDLTLKKEQLSTSDEDLVAAENAEDDAVQAASDAEAARLAAIDAHNDVKSDNTAKRNAKNLAEEAAKEIPSLDDEQKVLTDVINIMKGLHEKYADFKLGTCQPSDTYTKNECCVDGYGEIESEAECKKASEEANQHYGGKHGWQDRPAGCFQHQPNKHYHFNTVRPAHTLYGNDKVICKSQT